MSTSLGKTTPARQLPVHVRWMIRRDMPEVLEIERQSFEVPWIEGDFVQFLRRGNCIGIVAERLERVVGFVIYELHKNKYHILNFGVVVDLRHRGVGRQLIEYLAKRLSKQRRTRITLGVRESNLSAQLFFRSCGFRACDLIRGFYEESPEDAYVMEFKHE